MQLRGMPAGRGSDFAVLPVSTAPDRAALGSRLRVYLLLYMNSACIHPILHVLGIVESLHYDAVLPSQYPGFHNIGRAKRAKNKIAGSVMHC